MTKGSLNERLLFDEWREESPYVALVRRPSSVPTCLWFIGDLHGDLPALENAWRYIQQQSALACQVPHVLFLGDFIDRGPHSHETLLFLFRLIHDYPHQIGVIGGNHDLDLTWDEANRRFESRSQPAEYAESLNALLDRDDADSRERLDVAREAMAFFQARPRAMILPDGLLVTHGGFPHVDLLESLQGVFDLSRNECLQDFTWLRLSDSPRKKPNRVHRGCEFGYEDFARFCDWSAARRPFPIQRMIRGHDHVPERFLVHGRYETHPVLTLNTMGRKLEEEWQEGPCPQPCVARHVAGQLPEVHRVPMVSA